MQPERTTFMTGIKNKGLEVIPGGIDWSGANQVNWIAVISLENRLNRVTRQFWPRPRGNKQVIAGQPLVYVPTDQQDGVWRPIEIGNDIEVRKHRTRRRAYFAARVEGEHLLAVSATSPEDAISLARELNVAGDESSWNLTRDEPEVIETQKETDEMETSDILGMMTGLEQAICEENWGAAEYLSDQVMRAVGTRKRAAAAKARREQIEREREWASAHPGAGNT